MTTEIPGGVSAAATTSKDRPGSRDTSGRTFAIDAARVARDDKCENVLVLDVTTLSQVTDFLVIASGTSDRQMASVLQHIKELAEERGVEPFGHNRDTSTTWLLADYVDVVVHLFEPDTRAHYDLEMLWGDAPRVPWEPDDAPRSPPHRA